MAAVPLLVILLNFIAFLLTINDSYFTLAGCILSTLSFITISCRPYRRGSYNYLHSLVYLLASLALIVKNDQYHPSRQVTFFHIANHYLNDLNSWFTAMYISCAILFSMFQLFKAAKKILRRKLTALQSVVQEQEPLI